LPREYYEYSLVGIVVHMGSLESGHYYSYIKERGLRAAVKALERSGGSDAAAAAAVAAADPSWSGKWFEFNDSLVTDFDASRIPAECYGGSQGAGGTVEIGPQPANASSAAASASRMSVKNAYMLVYERRVPQPVTADVGQDDVDLWAADRSVRVCRLRRLPCRWLAVWS
jgi:hypothetical protein